jgi:hypothetical protein
LLLFVRRACPAPPGRVVVCMEPTLPVVKTGPLDVSIVWLGPFGNESMYPRPDADAWPADTASPAITRAANVHRVVTLNV